VKTLTDLSKPAKLDSELLEAFMQTFVGYGNTRAPYWYVGMEEGGDSTEESLRRRLELWRERGNSAIEDLREYHLATGLSEFFGEQAKLQTTWKQLIRMTLVAEGRPSDPEAMREYQARRLGRRNDETALLELYPLPAANLEHWPYGALSDLPVLRDRETYLDTLASKRIQLIQRMVDEHQPRFVVMYGTSYQEHWEHILGERLLIHPEIELSSGRRGRSEILVVKHPAAKRVTTAYFEAVGRYLGEIRRAA
jgi:hypothetical protein